MSGLKGALLVLLVIVLGAIFITSVAYEPSPALLKLRSSEPPFDDVPADHWAYEEIELIRSYGITVGCSYDPPLYCPDRPMTRAEAAVFAARLVELMGGEK